MPELIDNKQVFSLTEVANSIRKTISDRYSSGYWIRAEINKLNIYAKSGHCFPELVDKNEGVITCEMRATIWRNDFEKINRQFIKTINEPLKDGIKVLMFANITYEPKYGLSLVIRDIDPSFSLGELEREKKETIDKLQKEKLFGKNKLLKLALLPKRIAVISVETSKGYQDFLKVIEQNIFGYRFFHMLFPAVLQGDAAVRTIRNQLNRIKKVKHHFDCVAIIRGGGGDVGLSSFNNYQLAKSICNFPLPVFTGIGHSTNLTVCEMVSFQNAITPTELGDFLLQAFHNFAVPLQNAEDILLHDIPKILLLENRQFDNTTRLLKNQIKNRLREENQILKMVSKELIVETRSRLRHDADFLSGCYVSLKKSSDELIKSERKEIEKLIVDSQKNLKRLVTKKLDELEQTEKIIRLVDPMNVIKRGYSITEVNGKLLRDVNKVKKGDKLTTLSVNGTIESTVEEIKKNKI